MTTNVDDSKTQSIELDCCPGSIRPSDLLNEAIKNTSLSHREATTKLFGCWTFNYDDVDPDEWSEALPTIERNIRDLYKRGAIRYGSWT